MLNIPNTLTLLRILLIPAFLARFLTADSPESHLAAAGILVVSGLTDMLDGLIARKFHMTTQLGRILDPAADKLTLAAVMAALWCQWPRLWPLYAVFLLKEVLMLAGGLVLHRRRVEIAGARWFGKLSTVLFYVTVVVIVAHPELGKAMVAKMLLVLLAFMAFSLVRYGLLFLQMVRR
ncbi:MAG TPA: CDP-alcohol phosphatidyltransferase family protein [Candidatus Anaerotruncus excrementipullorum]|uniref:CDP-diacylglycerol--glycerol-3-phosphate 3-phosphatidyltransferase n=1 Tax=Candidatus Anaerotruncus excrementipullorum TaxID=2838465 RepID=A0A9D1WPD3_9FIRM|nr:CDP-alcohol phosphatidyltransferase family protein [Candidatus Anaerotruncus excrementipullorum]